jgi:hypothetical protein
MLNWDPCNAAELGEKPFPDGYDLLPKDRIGHCHCKDAVKKTRKGAQTRRLPLGRKPGNSLARCRHAGTIDATELGRHETRIAGGRSNLSRAKEIIVCRGDRQALGAQRASNACRKNRRLTLLDVEYVAAEF